MTGIERKVAAKVAAEHIREAERHLRIARDNLVSLGDHAQMVANLWKKIGCLGTDALALDKEAAP